MKRFLPLALLLAGCGIKANPQVLKPPEVEIRRIGQKVYVKSLSGDIKVKGFEKHDDYWVREEGKAFCLVVERLGEGSRKFCVPQALEERPSVRLLEEDTSVKVLPSGFEAYRLYVLRDGLIHPETAKTFMREIQLEKDYWERCYALTGLKGDVESQPVEFCVKPKPPPPVPEVEGLELRASKNSLYLVWFYPHPYREFVVYRDGKEIERTMGFALEVEPPKTKATYTVKVVGPLGFESSGVSVDYSP
ncbi:MAG: hypothetical protein WHS43_02710 [Aquificaceae bacterium]|uniref:hypothetical protein n=1 Tax=Hydrogenobacter sp. Uz 6-8 TaxID=3384828 RepID=UPI0030AF7631